MATHPERAAEVLKQQEKWMTRLGAAVGPAKAVATDPEN